jgi:deazaflavin-dependent oxidoreductase (nitroreductase family)
MSDWNAQIIGEFRANDGKVGGYFAGAPIALLHHRGRKSGREFVTPTMYLRGSDPNTIYVFASKSGAPTHPDWYHNLVAAGRGEVEVGTDTYPVTVAELTGEERDRVYAERELRRESLPIANGARESCAASRFMESSALRSSRGVRFDVATLVVRPHA